MESGKKPATGSSSPSSSFVNDLFGPKDRPSSGGYFGPIFSPPSKIMGRDYRGPAEVAEKKQEGKQGEGESNVWDSIFEGERGRVSQPCNLSSSLYYGGQDYVSPQGSQTSTSYKKGVEDDDPHTASRGDWWQGSFYY